MKRCCEWKKGRIIFRKELPQDIITQEADRPEALAGGWGEGRAWTLQAAPGSIQHMGQQVNS